MRLAPWIAIAHDIVAATTGHSRLSADRETPSRAAARVKLPFFLHHDQEHLRRLRRHASRLRRNVEMHQRAVGRCKVFYGEYLRGRCSSDAVAGGATGAHPIPKIPPRRWRRGIVIFSTWLLT